MPLHTSDFFSSQLIVLPKLNDLFLELKEMQCREKGTDKGKAEGEAVRGKRRETRPAGALLIGGRAFSPPRSRRVRRQGQGILLKK